MPEAGTYRGREQILELFGRFAQVLEDAWSEPQEFIDAGGDLVVVPVHWGGRGRSSGVEVAEREGETWVVTVKDGKLTTVTEYRHKEEAFEAAGPRE